MYWWGKGFGKILAILLWMPTVVESILTLGTLPSCSQDRKVLKARARWRIYNLYLIFVTASPPAQSWMPGVTSLRYLWTWNSDVCSAFTHYYVDGYLLMADILPNTFTRSRINIESPHLWTSGAMKSFLCQPSLLRARFWWHFWGNR
jgi:hypothetical protein